MQSFYALFRSSLFFFLAYFSVQLGGDSVVVHVDETPITRRHSNTGRTARSNTVWVISVVDVVHRKAALKFFPSRGHRDVLPFIQNFVRLNNRIHIYIPCYLQYP